MTVVTDPVRGSKSYCAWGEFPSAKTPIRKIVMHVTLGSPVGMRCADWDYSDRISIRRKGGVKGPDQNIEIGRMLTPYGGAFPKDWSFEWKTDVTDFSFMLRDSVEIEYIHTGYESNKDRGWALTINFEITKGTPAAEPVALEKVYDGQFLYGDSACSIEQQLSPYTFRTRPGDSFVRFRVYHSGHGMNATDDCGEFCSKNREVWFDNQMVERKAIWKKCGENPLSPQAGTWLYDRANWCPGYLLQPDCYDLKVKPETIHTVDLNMETYKIPKPTANEVISAYLIHYRKITATNDVAIEDIAVPSKKDLYVRKNPSCMKPVIIIKNQGSENLKNLTIRYGTLGFNLKNFLWKGDLPFNKTEEIVLPGEIQSNKGLNVFKVRLLSPNGKRDARPFDNEMVSSFESVPVLPVRMVLKLHTNHEPLQNSYAIKGVDGKIFCERKAGSMKVADSTYCDTLTLPRGAYQLAVEDTGGDGLEFWANPKGGHGSLQIFTADGKLIRNFGPDFGCSIYYGFRTDPKADSSILVREPAVALFPTLTTGKTELNYFCNEKHEVVVKILTDAGKLVEEHHYMDFNDGTLPFDLSGHPGRYYLKVFINEKLIYNNRIRVVKKVEE